MITCSHREICFLSKLGNTEILDYLQNESTEIISEISSRLQTYKEELDRLRLLEENQIKLRNIDALSPTSFESLVGQLFKSMGFYNVRRTGGAGDQGIDLECKSITNEKVIVQCKRYKGKVSVGVIRDFYGTMVHSRAKKGYVVTSGEFTEPARQWSTEKPIELINRKRLLELLDKYKV